MLEERGLKDAVPSLSYRRIHLSVTHLILPDGQRAFRMYLKQAQFIAQPTAHQMRSLKPGRRRKWFVMLVFQCG